MCRSRLPYPKRRPTRFQTTFSENGSSHTFSLAKHDPNSPLRLRTTQFDFPTSDSVSRPQKLKHFMAGHLRALHNQNPTARESPHQCYCLIQPPHCVTLFLSLCVYMHVFIFIDSTHKFLITPKRKRKREKKLLRIRLNQQTHDDWR